MAIADYLRDCGYQVFEASDAAEAKSIIQATVRVDLVFSDVNMPGTADGFALARWVRDHFPSLHVVLTSGMAGTAEKARDLCHGGPLITKPYDHTAVLARIRQLLRTADEGDAL
jgi:DNA-binding response OmpR family regulator